jgi:putative inorganic carbon (HCO3(-)) transporter
MLNISLLTVFLISYFLHLTARIPALGAMRFDLILGGAILISVFLTQTEDKWRTTIETARKLNAFLLYIFLSLPFVTWPGSVIRLNLVDWIKTALFFVFVVSVVRTEKQLKWIMYVFLGCQAFRILEPLYLHITTGYWGDIAYSHVGGTMTGLDRLSGAPFDVVNPNQLAWVIVTVIPFFFYLFWQGGIAEKVISLIAIPPFIYCMLLTGSRSGLLSLVAVIAGIVYFSKRRIRNFLLTIVIIFPVSIYVFGHISSGFQTRYESLVESDVAGADTASGRINASIRQLSSLSNNPLFGNGLGTSRETNWNVLGGSSQVSHNLYIEILQETGIIGFTIFIIFVVSIIKSLREAKLILVQAGRDEQDWLYRIISATQVWVFMDLFYSLSCFGLRSWEWYFFGGVATICLAFAREFHAASLEAAETLEFSDTEAKSRDTCFVELRRNEFGV